MPGKFLSSPVKTKKGSRMWLFVIIGLVVILVAAAALLFFRLRQPSEQSNGTTNTATNTNTANLNTNTTNANAATNGNTNAASNTNALAPTIVKGSLTDPTTNEKVSSATLTIPGGALPSSVTTVAMTAVSANVGAYVTGAKYRPIGAVYLLTPQQTQLTKDAALEITYSDADLLSLGFVVSEGALAIATWDQTEWKPINSLVDTKNNLITANINQFFADGVAIVVEKPAAANTNTSANTNTNTGGITPSIDSDADGLTNQEEILYGTNAGSADTDLDGFKDGQEVLGRYNPNGTGKLIDSSLVKLYENTTFRYSLYYPPSWTVGTLNADKLVTFTSITGEFIQVSVQENSTKKSAREWYLSLNPSVKASELRDVAVGSITGILGPDGLNIFLADKTYIYQVTYNIGIKTEANYLTTFTMMYSSFLTGITTTNTNTATNANSNTNTAGTTNTNSNTNSSSNTNGG